MKTRYLEIFLYDSGRTNGSIAGYVLFVLDYRWVIANGLTAGHVLFVLDYHWVIATGMLAV